MEEKVSTYEVRSRYSNVDVRRVENVYNVKEIDDIVHLVDYKGKDLAVFDKTTHYAAVIDGYASLNRVYPERVMRGISRFELLQAMTVVMRGLNNEEAYEHWQYLGASMSEKDLIDCSSDDDRMQECVEAFSHLMDEYSRDGYFTKGEYWG